MVPRALTLVEAQERARVVQVASYDIALDVTRGEAAFGSRTVIRFACTEPGASTFVEIQPVGEVVATLNGQPVEGLLGNRLPLHDLAADNVLVVEADMPYVTTGEGMHRYVDPLDGEVYVGAYLGVDNAQRVFACFDQPDLKATFTTTVAAPEGWTVLGNGLVTGGSVATTPRLSTYLFVVLAGPWYGITREHAGIPFGQHARRSLAAALDAEADELFDITTACFDRYAELFDEPYPYDSYDQVFVPELNWGAMESPGCITFRDEYVFRTEVTEAQRETRGMVIAHEMAHMWFGDLVTMRWWDDIWLSESFAEYMGYQVLSEATRFDSTWTSFSAVRKTWGYDTDQRPTTHPVAPEAKDVLDTHTALENFDGISYAKGASALRQLVAWVGEDVFLIGINSFLTAHRFENATLADLLGALSEASGLDVHGWADLWLRTAGVDVLALERDDHLTLTHSGQRPHRVALGLYDASLVLRDTVRITLSAGERAVTLPVDAPVVVVNDGDLTFAKTRTDPGSLALLTEGLSTLRTSLSRAVVWCELRDRVRDGELAAAGWVELVARHLPAEEQISLVQSVLSFTRLQVIDRYLPPSARQHALASLASTAQALRGSADAGVRLEGLRSLAQSGSVDQLRELLAGTTDQDLRWRVLQRLSVLGDTGESEVAAELAQDISGDGPVCAARCRAAFPTDEAKQTAWSLMFGDASNYVLAAIAQGFWQPEQTVLLEPYVARFFPAAVELAARRGPMVPGALGFPYLTCEESTLQLGQECLESGEASVALTRALTDHLDDLARVLRARSAHR